MKKPMDTYTCHQCGESFPADKRTSCRCCSPAKEEDEERLARTACFPSSALEPLRRAYSREEMRDASVKWMIEQYGRPIELAVEAKNRWHERCGMLYHFIFDHFPAENAIVVAPPTLDPASPNDVMAG